MKINTRIFGEIEITDDKIITFENGIIGISETGFMSYACPDVFEIYGTEGTLIRHGDDVKFRSAKIAPFTNDWVKPALPQAGSAPIMQFVDACINKTGPVALCTIDDAIDLTRLLENSYIGDRTNTIVTL